MGESNAVTALNMEKLAAERRMKARGTERVDGSGLVMMRRPEDRKGAAHVLAFVAMARAYEPIEDVVERNRHVPLPHSVKPRHDKETRAERDEWTRGIVDACED